MYINVGYEILQNKFMGQKIIVIVILVLLQHDLQRPFNIICAVFCLIYSILPKYPFFIYHVVIWPIVLCLLLLLNCTFNLNLLFNFITLTVFHPMPYSK